MVNEALTPLESDLQIYVGLARSVGDLFHITPATTLHTQVNQEATTSPQLRVAMDRNENGVILGV